MRAVRRPWDKAGPGVRKASGLLSAGESQRPGLRNLCGRWFMTLNSFWRICLQADDGVQRKPLPVFAAFHVTSAKNNQHTHVAYCGAARPDVLHRRLSEGEGETPPRLKVASQPEKHGLCRSNKIWWQQIRKGQ